MCTLPLVVKFTWLVPDSFPGSLVLFRLEVHIKCAASSAQLPQKDSLEHVAIFLFSCGEVLIIISLTFIAETQLMQLESSILPSMICLC
jgi:hypothetical protein